MRGKHDLGEPPAAASGFLIFPDGVGQHLGQGHGVQRAVVEIKLQNAMCDAGQARTNPQLANEDSMCLDEGGG